MAVWSRRILTQAATPVVIEFPIGVQPSLTGDTGWCTMFFIVPSVMGAFSSGNPREWSLCAGDCLSG